MFGQDTYNKQDPFTNEEVRHIPNVGLSSCGGAILTLHNKGGIRPTRYQITANEKGNFTLDTLIHENKEHECVKRQYDGGSKQKALADLLELSEQIHRGCAKETAKYYSPLGLLYWRNADTKRSYQ